MRIYNQSAHMALRHFHINQKLQHKAMERLASGMRINRAADDPAGLAISEKMRAQIRGLNQAVRNAQDGISLIQTAEGALNETHAMLQRVRELTTQAANDTYNDFDREQIQKEINELLEGINQIGTSTEFNTKPLLSGDGEGGSTRLSLQIGANAGQTMQIEIGNMGLGGLLLSNDP